MWRVTRALRPAVRQLWRPQRAFSSTLAELRVIKAADLAKLPEVQQRSLLEAQLAQQQCTVSPDLSVPTMDHPLIQDKERLLTVVEASLATFLLHVESRISSALGHGFYTIGPCGEELLSAVGVALREDDAVALHYRHLATQIARHRNAGISMDSILLDRARGHVVSALDPVTGGGHCALGGGELDFLVTSTLASQSCPAVGRALGNTLAHHLKIPNPKFKKDFVSYVSLGDGSTHNGHFLSALNLADFTSSRRYKVPVVFGISDNDIAISLKGNGWVPKHLIERLESRFKVFRCNGNDAFDVYTTSQQALTHARTKSAPTIVIFQDLQRRFGHAATDRQAAYKTADEIAQTTAFDPVQGFIAQAVATGAVSYGEVREIYDRLVVDAEASFDAAALEPKIDTREMVLDRLSQPLTSYKASAQSCHLDHAKKGSEVMRKHMTRVLDETLEQSKDTVYIGEDVEHGGYYLVSANWKPKDTQLLVHKYPFRVADFPPDETSLIGAGMGYAQAGLVPIVEIPYAKYLDCGADIFWEAATSNWLSNGNQPNGMYVRLQGFGKGVFGGNFHTHNMLTMPPGVDVVCYSNGHDYAKGFRYSMEQVRAGRMVMSVDCTHLLNLRHLQEGVSDNLWRRPYPAEGETLAFDEVVVYESQTQQAARLERQKPQGLVLVSYGDGVLTCLQAKKALVEEHGYAEDDITVIDSPLLSRVPDGLKQALPQFSEAVFVDICKEGQHPFASHITHLNSEGALPAKWQSVAAQRTYNPLGNTLTFTSVADVIDATKKIM